MATSNATRFLVLCLVVAAVAVVAIVKGSKPRAPGMQASAASAATGAAATEAAFAGQVCDTPLPQAGETPGPGAESTPKAAQGEPKVAGGVPRLLDLGSGTCIPCKMMVPVLEELRTKYKGKLQVDYISVVENPEAAVRYRIEVIPTQIFYDASGKELSRHAGFWSTADIIERFASHGIRLDESKKPGEPAS